MSRQAGWYWVKEHSYENWVAWHWNGVDFAGVDEDCFAEIGPRIPTPDEPWQCVPVEPTREMAESGQIASEAGCHVEGIYCDMIAAAPKPGGGDEP
ncbi:hypothetical protein [Halomonas sp. MMSF_3323]|uniref:hypothetical protein n=1 Tax=Halomonas sp. MMSF_3323 TaxID=3046701 RepID=UPI00273DE23D|nr:hypothetical protein [Halomonas sp. MMSF_3323]